MKNKSLPKSLDRLVTLLSTAFEKEGKLSPLRTKELVVAADVQGEDLMPYADYDHPVADCYGRQMVYNHGEFEVMVMSWNPGDYSSIHNHGYTEWGVVQVFGHAHHCIFNVRKQVLDFSKKEILPSGSVVKVNNALIHQMGNPTTERYLSLHVYGSNERSGDITADAQNYELEFDRISLTTGGAFFNLPEGEVYDFQEGPQPTEEVFMHYAHLLLDYYSRQPETDEILELKKNILSKLSEYMMESVGAAV